jgi:hypothetical protein
VEAVSSTPAQTIRPRIAAYRAQEVAVVDERFRRSLLLDREAVQLRHVTSRDDPVLDHPLEEDVLVIDGERVSWAELEKAAEEVS